MDRFTFTSVKIITALFLMVLAMDGLAQVRKGERLMGEGRYLDAVKPLKKAFENDEDRKAGLLLIESYYVLQQYQDALDVSALLDLERTVDEREMILYADVLIANNDFSSAYLALIRLLGEGGTQVQAYQWLGKTGNLLEWDSLTTGSTVSDLQGLNTIYNEYSPYLMGDRLNYIADHLTVQVLYPSAFTNQSLHLLFSNKETSEQKFGKPKMFLKGREYYYHDGPMEKRPRTGVYALTLREIEGLLYDLKMNIFFTNLSGSEEDLESFKYNGTHNTGHPTFNQDGSRMYFTSDRPGGYGQLDIWYTDWVDGDWTVPQNAGPGINTPNNELYPTIRYGRLFFSSDRRDIGYGGLDLYYVSLLSVDTKPYNLRAPINSAYDDFGLDFKNKKDGYFSSNNDIGFGGDDIYEMFFQPDTIRMDTVILTLEDGNGIRKNMRIYDSAGNEMVGLSSDNVGTATSVDMLTRELYTIETDSVFEMPLSLTAYNKFGDKIVEFAGDSSSFLIEFLNAEEFEFQKQENTDESELYDLLGAVVSLAPQDFNQVAVVLESEKGPQTERVKTDSIGRFTFKGLTWDEAYNISTEGTIGEVEIDIMGQTGAPITTLEKIPGRNSFTYTRARPEADWMMTTGTEIPFVFGIVPEAEVPEDAKPDLLALGDTLIRTCDVDEDGFVEMGSLMTGHAYELSFDKADFDRGDRLVILDGSGDTTQTVRPDGNSAFAFELMPPPKTAKMPEEQEFEPIEDVGKESIVVSEEMKLVNLRGVSAELSDNGMVKLYNSKREFISETYAKENGGFTFSQVLLDSIYFIGANIREEVKLTSVFHGFERSGDLEPDSLWKFNFTEVDNMEKIVSLPNIYYAFDSYTLSPESKESLDNLYGFMRQNPNQKIKLLAHTDKFGKRAYNEKLSNLRAREVVRYLIRRGIEEGRLSYEGRGESQPVNECRDGVWCPKEKHAENRRTEFVLLKN